MRNAKRTHGKKDHPRLCGEKWLPCTSPESVRGSPPPMRGKAMQAIQDTIPNRITPAYAGKSLALRNCGASGRDHPRLCGEKFCFFECNQGHTGITPAYAGKRRSDKFIFAHVQDHPRLCGEKITATKKPTHKAGSPPPMRGKDKWSNANSDCDRITPAYAGKRFHQMHLNHANRDHPRLCGEKSIK